MRLKDKLDNLEARLQLLIEGGAARLFPDYTLKGELAHRLVAALQGGVRQSADGSLIAPNLFVLVAHPEQAGLLRQQENYFDEVTQILEAAAEDAGLRFLSPPVIRILDDSEIPLNSFGLSAQISLEKLAHTTDFLVEVESRANNIPENAFLIVDGTRIFPLTRSVINVGRRPDNQMVIDDRRVSRVHAQLRAINGRYVIFDLDSTGGTFVNSQRISQSTLYQGDVISLAGFPMVYGQDFPAPGETQEYVPPNGKPM